MVSLGPAAPYRKGAKVEANMDVSEIARRIEKTYSRRFGNTERVRVQLSYRRYYVSPIPSMHGKERTEEEKYEREYDAALMLRDSCLARVSSKISFDESIAKLAQQLEVKL